MNRTMTLAAMSVGLSLASSLAQAQPLLRAQASSSPLQATVVSGRIEGVVTDDAGTPLAGAAVSVVGPDSLFGVSDRDGRFVFAAVPVGTYLVRAQRAGYHASPREFLDVDAAEPALHSFALVPTGPRPAEGVAAEEGSQVVIAAGFGGNGATVASAPSERAEDDSHDHTPRLWRLRHLKRSVLRDLDTMVVLDSLADELSWIEDRAGRVATGQASARATTNYLGEASLSGQVQLLTSTAFDGAADGEGMLWERVPSGVAYATVGAPLGGSAQWSVRGALSRGDLSSWIVAGSFTRAAETRHALDVGASFALQSYTNETPAALISVAEQRRSAGTIHAFDTFRIHRRAAVTYGARYAWHDYLDRKALMSPTVALSVSPFDKTWLRVAVTQQMLAPGAEEFDARNVSAFSLPPQRTFTAANASGRLSAERTRHVEVGLERDVASFVVGVRHFQQRVDNQLVTLFGVGRQGLAPDLGHYLVANGGNFASRGWVVGVHRHVGTRFVGGVEYTTATATWASTGERGLIARLAPSASRLGDERMHDVTARITTEIPETATRVSAAYKVNTAFARRSTALEDASADARFDIQVSQRLPFLSVSGADWELMVSVRNLFRDGMNIASVYDELLVVRPPKRVVGGVLVKF
jgi:hypothetical protein